MIPDRSHKQIPLAEFDWPFQVALDENNRWVKMSEFIPCDELAEGYYQGFSSRQGRPLKDARLAIGAVIIDAVEKAKVKNNSNKQTRSAQNPDGHDDDPPCESDTIDKEQASPNQGKLILDATVAPQTIRYPTDLNQ